MWDYHQRKQLTSITLSRLGGSCWFVGHLGSLALTGKEDPKKGYRGVKKNSLKCVWFADLGRKTVGIVVCLIVYRATTV